MSTHRPILNSLINLTLVLGGLLMALLLAEGVARWLGPPYEIGDEAHRSHQCDPSVGWRGVPNSSTRMSYHDHPHELRWNGLGLRGRLPDFEKAADSFRILLLGDSMVAALEVADEETAAQQLEDYLNAHGPNGLTFEVINAGVFAWGPPQALMQYRTHGPRFQPDLVIASWYPGNDLRDVLPYSIMTAGPSGGVHCFAPYFELCDHQFDPHAWFAAPGISPNWQACSRLRRGVTTALNAIYTRSRLYQRLTAALLQVYQKEGFDDLAPWLDQAEQDEQLKRAYQLTRGIYGQLAHEAAAQGAKTVVLMAPINEAIQLEVNPDIKARLIADLPMLATADTALPHHRLTELMVAEGIPVLDLQPAFVSHVKQGGEALYWSDKAVHWNVAGNRFVGQRLGQWLLEQGLVPSE